MASTYCDPISKIGAQDEAVYFREAIEMTQHGNWLTPTYLGRYVLNKPPLLQWLTAATVSLFGPSAWSARVVSLLAASLIATLIFVWMAEMWSIPIAAAGILLLVSSHLFYLFARLCVTDMLLTLWITGAMFVLGRDPALRNPASPLLFGAAVGAGVMTKAAAGLLPVVALGVAAMIATGGERPAPRRLLIALAAAAAIGLPWHLYQLAAHPRWFIAEYVLTQHLSIGLTAPPQYSSENHLLFYTRRLLLMDPVLSVAAAGGLALALRSWRRHKVVLAWSATLFLSIVAFRYRSAYYLLPLLPACAMLSGTLLARVPRRWLGPVFACIVAAIAVKTAEASASWGLPAMRVSQPPGAAALEQHCARNRGNELILVDPDDQFYSSDLPLRRVRYCLLDGKAARTHIRRPLDFEWLGIAIPAAEFNRLDAFAGLYRERLRSYGLTSGEPIGTVLLATSDRDVEELIAGHPGADFFLRHSYWQRLTTSTAHDVVPAAGGRVFLLSRQKQTYQPEWACEL